MESDVRAPIDVYLDAVELSLLNSRAPRQDRVGIVRDLESQILDMLRERAAGREPTVADVAAILSALDAPDAYAANVASAAGVKALVPERTRRVIPGTVKWGAALCAGGSIGSVILVNSYVLGRFHNPYEVMLLMLAATPVVVMLALGALVGFAAFRAIRDNPARYWGKSIALLEVVPLMFFVMIASPVLFFGLLLTSTLLFISHRLFDLRVTTRRFLATLE